MARGQHPQQEGLVLEIKRAGSASQRGPAEYFTGEVTLELPFEAEAPGRLRGATVRFAAGARTAWHTHPLGQTIVVTEGEGWAQRWGGPIEVLRVGDVVCFSPGEKHWHGATASSAMAHVAVQEALDGQAVDWLEQVSEAQYLGQA